MIPITRAFAHELRVILRKSVLAGHPRHTSVPIVFESGRDGLRIYAVTNDVAVEFRQSGSYSPDHLILPIEALNDFEGRDTGQVQLTVPEAGTVRAAWDSKKVPQNKQYASPKTDHLPPFPPLAERFTEQAIDFLVALAEASQAADSENVRYALSRLQLRGSADEIVATDGKQLLIQSGFTLPWKEDLLIPALDLFGARELAQYTEIGIGKTTSHVCLRIGPWTFHLRIDAEGRYPPVDQVVPKKQPGATTWRIQADDAAFLAETLPQLAGHGENGQALTIDLNGHAAIRTQGAGQPEPTEVTLVRSAYTGPAVRLCMPREQLIRALHLGTTELSLNGADSVLAFRGDKRTYACMPFASSLALAPVENAIRLNSTAVTVNSAPPLERRVETMATPSNGQSNGTHTAVVLRAEPNKPEQVNGTASSALITEVQALKELLRDAYRRTNAVMATIRRQRKQSKLTQNALAALRQLQKVEA